MINDKTYQEALRQREELRYKLKALDDLIDAYERYLTIPPAPPDMAPRAGRVRGLLSPVELAEISRNAILEVGRPMTRGELVKLLTGRDVPLAGKDKAKNLGTILWRSGRFVQVDGVGYWPADVELPQQYRGKVVQRTG